MKTICIIMIFFSLEVPKDVFALGSNRETRFDVRSLINKNIYSTQDSLMTMKAKAISDCNYTLEEALKGTTAPVEVKNNLVLVEVFYYSFDHQIHKGQIVIHRLLAKDIEEIFDSLLIKEFPIEKVIPIVRYNWSDELSMLDNNTSAFNYRLVAGSTKTSNHSFGIAIDINPKLNPYIKGNHISPEGATYNPEAPGTILSKSVIVNLFKQKAWTWGGDWQSRKDYQHFEKIID